MPTQRNQCSRKNKKEGGGGGKVGRKIALFFFFSPQTASYTEIQTKPTHMSVHTRRVGQWGIRVVSIHRLAGAQRGVPKTLAASSAPWGGVEATPSRGCQPRLPQTGHPHSPHGAHGGPQPSARNGAPCVKHSLNHLLVLPSLPTHFPVSVAYYFLFNTKTASFLSSEMQQLAPARGAAVARRRGSRRDRSAPGLAARPLRVLPRASPKSARGHGRATRGTCSCFLPCEEVGSAVRLVRRFLSSG